jgi:NAD(P)-dependent dehydrogenase (short-subunit alcohol dehydrogenase family)
MKRLEIDFEGRTVSITGAATGIGRATAVAFGAARASVTIGDVDTRAEATASEIVAVAGKAVFALVGVTGRVGSRLATELLSRSRALTGVALHVHAMSAKSGSRENRGRSQFPT